MRAFFPSVPGARAAAAAAALGVCAAGMLAVPAGARAETEGRITLSNGYTMVTGPDASFDAALVRIWLRSERIGGRNLALIVDGRSDVPLMASASKEFELNGTTIFNDQCRGDAGAEAHEDCRDVPLREQRFGQLLHGAGFYDAFLRFGEVEEGKSNWSIGRRTIYEAGLATVDGLTFERLGDRTRYGLFAGAAPDPLTRMFNGEYQTLGGYYAKQTDRAWIRLGAVAQAYKFEADRVTIHNHDFWGISKSLRLAALVQFDVVPEAQERLVQLDLTFRPSGQYRIRASVIRFRPWDFAVSEAHIIQPPEDLLIEDFRSATRGTTPVESVFRGRFDYRNPEVLEAELRTSAINQGKLVAHYTTARSLSPFVSAAYRTREIDGKSAIVAGGGVYAYDFYDTGVTGRLRLEHTIGFDHDSDRVGFAAERRMSESFAFGGGVEYGTAKYKNRDELLNAGYPKSSTFYGVSAQTRFETARGFAVFAQADYLGESRTMPAQNTTSLEPDKDSTTLSILAGITYRF